MANQRKRRANPPRKGASGSSRSPSRSTGGGQSASAPNGTRRRRLAAISVVGVVIAVVVVLVLVKALSGGGSSKADNTSTTTTAASGSGSSTSTPATTAPAANRTSGPALQALQALQAVPVSQLAQAAAKASDSQVKAPDKLPSSAPRLESGGKPEVLYIGAEFCPFCAAQRWAVVLALSKFGQWSNLGTTHSASRDVYPNTQTFTFHGASFTSSYLNFTGVETTTNQPQGNGYVPLDTPSAKQQELVAHYDSDQSIPFLYIGGRWLALGASYNPQVLAGKSVTQIAAAMRDPSSDIAQSVEAAAGRLTKSICTITDNQPGSVCSAFS